MNDLINKIRIAKVRAAEKMVVSDLANHGISLPQEESPVKKFDTNVSQVIRKMCKDDIIAIIKEMPTRISFGEESGIDRDDLIEMIDNMDD